MLTRSKCKGKTQKNPPKKIQVVYVHVILCTCRSTNKKKTAPNQKYEKKNQRKIIEERRKKCTNTRSRHEKLCDKFCHECKYLKYILVLSLYSVALISDVNIYALNSKLKANICFVCGLLSHFTKRTYTHIHIQPIRNQKEPQCKYHKLRILSEQHEKEKAIEQENKKKTILLTTGNKTDQISAKKLISKLNPIEEHLEIQKYHRLL